MPWLLPRALRCVAALARSRRHALKILFVAGLGLAGCVAPADISDPAARAAMLARFRSGQTELDCTVGCIAAWLQHRQEAGALDAAARWEELALLVARIGYTKDIGYYYLGRAAAGLGLPGAAHGYYERSLALATGPARGPQCRWTPETCNGVDLLAVLPRILSPQIAEQPTPRRSAAVPRPRSGSGANLPQYCRSVGDDDAGGDYAERLSDGGRQSFRWRCMDGRAMVCAYGANARHCARNGAGMSPTPAIRSYCAGNPDSFVPGAANDTSLEWRCRGRTPVLDQPGQLDRRGFNAASWEAM